MPSDFPRPEPALPGGPTVEQIEDAIARHYGYFRVAYVGQSHENVAYFANGEDARLRRRLFANHLVRESKRGNYPATQAIHALSLSTAHYPNEAA